MPALDDRGTGGAGHIIAGKAYKVICADLDACDDAVLKIEIELKAVVNLGICDMVAAAIN